MRIFSLLLVSTALLLGPSLGVHADEKTPRRASGDIRIRGHPDGLGRYEMVSAFPNLRFKRPLYVGFPPDGTNRLFVLEQDGIVSWFQNRPGVSQRVTALDIRHKVYRRHNEEGLLGLAFHPDFKRNRFVFLHYSANNPRRGVIARYQMDTARERLLPKSERVILQQPQPWGNHNGGGLAFGPDGYLYIPFGDGGAGGDPRGAGQDLGTWLGSMLRIDVDRPRKGRYSVPPDNPFVGRPGARPEIWAYGLRNIWRFSFDRLTGELWGGDVGQNRWEEIDLIRRGGNYGWDVREGHSAFEAGPHQGPLLDPVISIGTGEARSITGGYVYRGQALPDLRGAYVYGDYATGNLWALRWDGSKVTANKLIGRHRSIASFGEDAAGEIYLTSFDGRIYRLARGRGAPPPHQFPARLSETGLFTDTARHLPHASLLPYVVNVPLWSDGAEKQRLVMVPGTAPLRAGPDGHWQYPVGTIFVKTFHVGGLRLETRLFLHRDSGWAGYTYLWNDAQTDATLIDAGIEKPLPPRAAKALGVPTWHYPGRSDCMSCHTAAAGFVLGFRPEQIDRLARAGTQNQLELLAERGLVPQRTPATHAWPAWNTTRAETGPALQAGVRAYLDVNCASCHQPGAPGNARIDLRYETPLAQAHLLNEAPGQGDLGVSGAKIIVPGNPSRSLLYLRMARTDEKGMPNLAHAQVDREALRAVSRWIKQLPRAPR